MTFIGRRHPSSLPTRAVFALLFAAGTSLLVSCDRVLVDDRFNGGPLRGWTVVDDPETVEIPSNWDPDDDGWLHQRSNIWGRRGDFMGRWYGTMLVAGDDTWEDYNFSVKARPADDDGFGVVFRFKDSEHFYRLFLVQDGLSGGPFTRLDKRIGPDYTELWSSQLGFKPGEQLLIRVEVISNSITAWINDRRLFEVTDESYASGKIGLFCYAQDDQAFDDVRVERR